IVMTAVVLAVDYLVTFSLEHVANSVVIENLGLEFKAPCLYVESNRQPRGADELGGQPPSLLGVIGNRIALAWGVPEGTGLRQHVAEDFRKSKCAKGRRESASAGSCDNGSAGVRRCVVGLARPRDQFFSNKIGKRLMAVKVASPGVLTGIGDAYGNCRGNLMLRDKVIKDHRKRYEFLIRVTVKDDEKVTAFAPGRIMRWHVDPNGSFLLEMFTLE